MNRLIFIVLYLFISAFSITGVAQSVKWIIQPNNYVDIQCIGKQLYRATREDGKLSIVTCGSCEMPESMVTCDEITQFYQGWALLLIHDDTKKRRLVIGCLSSDGSYNTFEKPFYTLAKQEFYSEGFLTVENTEGKKVYIDYLGNEVIGADKKYSKITPFSEGYAVVFINNHSESFHINKDGQKIIPRSTLLNNISLIQVTNLRQGYALMMGRSNDYYICDINGNGKKLRTRPKNIEVDYLYRMVNDGETPQATPPYDPVYQGDEDAVVKPVVDGKGKEARYGYAMTNGGEVLLPCQFSYAEPVIDGLAIVKMVNGKCGILQFASEEVIGFTVTPVRETIEYLPDETVTCKFKVIPSNSWQDQELTISIDNGLTVSSVDRNTFSFDYKPNASKGQDFLVKIFSQGILLQTSPLYFVFKQKEKPKPKCATCGEDKNKCPHRGKHKTCTICKKVIDTGHKVSNRCKYDGNHPEPAQLCPICKKPINKCKFKGNHPDIF